MGRYRIFTTLALSLFFSALALLIEFDPVRVDALFFTWLYRVPFVITCVLSLFFLISGIRRLLKHKQRYYLILSAICLLTIVICIWRKNYLENIDHSETIFRAKTRRIGNDGGLTLNFKKDGNLVVDKGDHWVYTQYWGTYTRTGDTVTIDVPLDFKFGRRGILDSTSLRMLGDTMRLEVIYLSPDQKLK